jgi:hypothetical protein
VKILRRSRCTPACGGPSGPFTLGCPTCPSVPAVPVVRFTGSPATRQHAVASGHLARYPASYMRRPAEGAAHDVSLSCRLSTCRRSLLGHPVPARDLGLPYGRLTGPLAADRTLTGFPHIAQMRPGWGWAPSLSRGQRCPHGHGTSVTAAGRIPAACPCLPGVATRPEELKLRDISEGSRSFAPCQPSPRLWLPDGTAVLGRSLMLSTPPLPVTHLKVGDRSQTLTWAKSSTSADPPLDVATHTVQPHVAMYSFNFR